MPTLQIGSFTFPRLPKGLDFDMKRRIARQEPAGAPNVYQDMGLGEKTMELSGTFDDEDAWATSQEIERLLWSGQELVLRYDDIQKFVRVESYHPKLIRKNRVDYTLHLIVCFPESELESMAGLATSTGISQGSTAIATDLGGLLDSTYTIKSGDTLWDLAGQYLGDPTKWGLLANANGIENERALQLGQKIRIPSPGNKAAALVAYESGNLAALGPTGKQELDAIMKGVA